MPNRKRLHIPLSLPPKETLEVLVSEMNLPLQSVFSYARLLETETFTDDIYREAVQMILAHTESMQVLLDGVRDYLGRAVD
ncbi:MAG: hypothetical protein K8I82_26050 [Anaerolineae bacterium]|nr:hypothetical protein [Anaerolineae bacterium]